MHPFQTIPLLALLAVLACVPTVQADHCRAFFQHHPHKASRGAHYDFHDPHRRAFKQQANYYYFVGHDQRVEALIDKKLRDDEEFQLYLEFRRNREAVERDGRLERRGGPPGAVRSRLGSNSALGRHCASCHSGSAPEAGLTFDGQSLLECEDALSALREIAAGRMPQGAELTAEEKGALMQEILDLSESGE